MSRRRLSLAVGLVLAFLSGAACYSYRPQSPAPADASVRVRLNAPSAVATLSEPGDSLPRVCPDALEVQGILMAAAPDTLFVRIREIRGPRGELEGWAGRVAAIPVALTDRVDTRQVSVVRTALLGVAAFGVAGTAYIMALVLAMISW